MHSVRGGGVETPLTAAFEAQEPHGSPRLGTALVAEVAFAREDHGDAALVGGGDHFVVTDGAARLDDGRAAGVHHDVETVAEKPADAASFIVKTTQYFVPLDGKIDVEEELKKLQHDLAYYEGFLASVRKKLGNERFVQNAPAQVVENERAKQNDAEAKIKALKERIATLGR